MVDGHRVRRPPEASDRVHFCVSRLHCKRFVRRKNAPGAQPSTAGGGRNGMANVGLTGQSDRAVGDLSQQTTTCRPPRPSQISWNGPTASQVSGVEPWPAMQEDWRARVAKPQGLRFAAVAPPWAPRRSGHSATPAHIAGESHVHRNEVPHPLVWGRLVHPSCRPGALARVRSDHGCGCRGPAGTADCRGRCRGALGQVSGCRGRVQSPSRFHG